MVTVGGRENYNYYLLFTASYKVEVNEKKVTVDEVCSRKEKGKKSGKKRVT